MKLGKRFLAACLCVFALAVSGSAMARQISFDLRDDKGPVTQKSYPGKYLLLAIGYTSCPDICPTTLYEYGGVMKSLKHPDRIQPIFVTIDPTNDEVGRLNVYTKYFDERIVGLTGEMKNIRALTDQLGATFGYRLNGKKLDNPVEGEPYTVYHSALIYLIDPQHNLVDVFDYQMGAEGLTEVLDKVLDEGSANDAKGASGDAGAATKGAQAATTVAAAGAATAAGAAGTTQTSDAAPNAKAASGGSAAGNSSCALPEGFRAATNKTALRDILPDADTSKPVLLNLWATWCAPCRVELPVLDKFAGSQQDMSVQTLNLADKPAAVKELFEKMKLTNLPQTITEDRSTLRRLGGPGLPFTALFVNGEQVGIKAGLIDKTDSLANYAQCLKKST